MWWNVCKHSHKIALTLFREEKHQSVQALVDTGWVGQRGRWGWKAPCQGCSWLSPGTAWDVQRHLSAFPGLGQLSQMLSCPGYLVCTRGLLCSLSGFAQSVRNAVRTARVNCHTLGWGSTKHLRKTTPLMEKYMHWYLWDRLKGHHWEQLRSIEHTICKRIN